MNTPDTIIYNISKICEKWKDQDNENKAYTLKRYLHSKSVITEISIIVKSHIKRAHFSKYKLNKLDNEIKILRRIYIMRRLYRTKKFRFRHRRKYTLIKNFVLKCPRCHKEFKNKLLADGTPKKTRSNKLCNLCLLRVKRETAYNYYWKNRQRICGDARQKYHERKSY